MNLGYLYDMGKGVPRNFGYAAALYEKAAKQGVHMAMYALGTIYTRTDSGLRDLPKAEYWMREATKSNDADERKMSIEAVQRLQQMQADEYSWGNKGFSGTDVALIALFSAALHEIFSGGEENKGEDQSKSTAEIGWQLEQQQQEEKMQQWQQQINNNIMDYGQSILFH